MTVFLSAVIIAKNEERDLPACLDSLTGVADEVVVVDGGSTDRTKEVAVSRGARVFDHEFKGYGPQKQFGLEQAQGEWVINIDADERLSPALAQELKSFRQQSSTGKAGFWIPFQLFFMGRRLRFGGCGGERHLRLFRRELSHYGQEQVHEGIFVKGPLGTFRSPMIHVSYAGFDDYLEKCRIYTGLIARRKFEQGKRFYVWQHGRFFWEFLARYVFKLGFLDGSPGFSYALLSAMYAWLKHVRVWEEEHG